VKNYIKYITKNLLLPVILSTVTLTAIICLSQSLRYISLVVNSGAGFWIFLKLTLLITPSLLIIILPISTFISVLYTYNKLILDSELVVLKNAGLSRFSLSKPAIIIAIFTTLLGYFTSLYLLPVSYKEFKDQVVFYRDNYASVLLEEGVFNTKIKGLTIYIEEYLPDKTLKNILVYDHRNAARPITMMASKGRFIKTGTSTNLELINGNRQEINNEGQLAILYFDNFKYDLSLEFTNNEGRSKELQERFLPELLYPKDMPDNVVSKFKAEGHQRLTWPLYNFILTIIALLAVYPPEFNRKGQNKRILSHAMLAAALIVVYFFFNYLIARFPILTPLLYINVLATGACGLYYLFRQQVID